MTMDQHEKAVLKAACLEAAATMLADQFAQMVRRGINAAPDTAACVRFARDMFEKSTGEPWADITEPAEPARVAPDPKRR
jgi:hypothetical protein